MAENGMTAREIRHRRRVRQQRLYTLIALLILALIGTGIYFGVRFVLDYVAERNAAQAENSLPAPVVEAPGAGATEQSFKTPEELQLDEVNGMIAGMTLSEKAAGLFLVTADQLTGIEGVTQAGDATSAALKEYPVAGIVYEAQNMTDRAQLQGMISATRQMAKYPLFIAACEAGGEGASPVGTALGEELSLSPQEIGASNNTSAAQEAGYAIGAYLTKAGFNLNLTPSANLALSPGSNVYGDNMQMVSGMSVAMVKGLHAQGIFTCTGAFPLPSAEDAGGSATSTQQTMTELQTEAFVPFRDCITAGTDLIMLSNIAAPRAVGGIRPCTVSEEMIQEQLRQTLGYTGIIMTAPLDQDIITNGYTSDNIAVAALVAGADIIYRPEDYRRAHKGIVDAVENGVLTEERIDQSLRRILRLKLSAG